MIIREVEKPKIKDLFNWGLENKEPPSAVLGGIKLVGSGKGALAIILQYLKEKGIIANKLDEVMVADWVGYWVYNQIQPFAFPAKKFSERTKVLLVYHQYGFPQDMDKIMAFAREKNLIVIEDCAHALDSRYKGQLLGTFGDFAIYSFSKWFFCFALGGVKSKFGDFPVFADKLIKETPLGATFMKDSVKFLSEKGLFSRNSAFKKYASLLMSMSYSLYGEALRPSFFAQRLFRAKIDREIILRQKRYRYFLDKMKGLGVCDHLEKDGVTPYVIPIHCPESKNEEILKALKEMNVRTGLYRFDIARNMLAPNFAPVIWVPCHGGIDDELFFKIADSITKIIKE